MFVDDQDTATNYKEKIDALTRIDGHPSTLAIHFFFTPTRSTIPGFIYTPNATIATPFFLEGKEEKDSILDLWHLIYCRRTITTESIPKRQVVHKS